MRINQILLTLVMLLSFGSMSATADDLSGMLDPEQGVTVNVNEADAMTIAAVLKGVGLSRAQAIVEYREKNGKFFSAEELTSVRGIGKTTVQKNAGKIAVK